MGHVVNYAYRLYDDEEWVKHFGSITQPYDEEYRPEPFSRRYVRHLPGWYAQKHPDEDWAETFAVWMTPGLDWRAEYGGWPVALGQAGVLRAHDAPTRRTGARRSPTTLDEDVGEIEYSLDQYYRDDPALRASLPPGLDGALRAIFEDLDTGDGRPGNATLAPAAALIRRLERRTAGQRLSLDGALSRAHACAAQRIWRSARTTWSWGTRREGDERYRGADDAGHRAGDEPRAAGQLPAVALEREVHDPLDQAGIVHARRARPWRTRSPARGSSWRSPRARRCRRCR